MEVFYIVIPVAVMMLGIVVCTFLWCVRDGQYDDLERQGSNILFDDDLDVLDPNRPQQSRKDGR
jgi:cbb3-type cytochrome oxidase maturation protein